MNDQSRAARCEANLGPFQCILEGPHKEHEFDKHTLVATFKGGRFTVGPVVFEINPKGTMYFYTNGVIPDGGVESTMQVHPEVNLDLDAEGHVIGIEYISCAPTRIPERTFDPLVLPSPSHP